ncbi:hypothetical protein [Mycobacterium szulgai]|uniref:Uncharacterized protein n=1 Tax=Mycobacterium szulgai TaxID=1787 RepID=A0A1X2EH16_MYCSZ|nr:hypothetical protein [Mycobacterium szulgai]MCV7079127.1 hypothetical protein [Mycobacterium szulgai]ORX01707.1 hypothetical protein AWC27_00220 [Mycobacterium szulgai]
MLLGKDRLHRVENAAATLRRGNVGHAAVSVDRRDDLSYLSFDRLFFSLYFLNLVVTFFGQAAQVVTKG